MSKYLHFQVAKDVVSIPPLTRVEIETIEAFDVADSGVVGFFRVGVEEAERGDDEVLVDAGARVGDVEVAESERGEGDGGVEVAVDAGAGGCGGGLVSSCIEDV